jgi:hypothetical protein
MNEVLGIANLSMSLDYIISWLELQLEDDRLIPLVLHYLCSWIGSTFAHHSYLSKVYLCTSLLLSL